LNFLVNVGLDYLTLNRSAVTSLGGEAQRIRLATQVGSRLVGVLYVLDEPSIGLHPRDNSSLLETLKGLRDLGNTVLVVEHDDETIREADWVIDLGPAAGEHGGQVIAEGTPKQILAHPKSLTGQYLSGRKQVEVPKKRREGNGKNLKIVGATANNLKKIDVTIPLGKLVCITGVSGSGKSTLMSDILYNELAAKLMGARTQGGEHERSKASNISIRSSTSTSLPLDARRARTPARTPGLFDEIRKLYAELPESKVRGYKPGRFSFNVHGGRCEACQGQGELRIEMQFLPDVYVPCDVCHGKRFNRETLQVLFRDKYSISDVLDMTVDHALENFKNYPQMQNKLKLLQEVGLGYVRVGSARHHTLGR
jgi:excinuclease ABC subunit A